VALPILGARKLRPDDVAFVRILELDQFFLSRVDGASRQIGPAWSRSVYLSGRRGFRGQAGTGIPLHLAVRQELSRPPFCLALESAAGPITLLQVKK